MITIEELQRVFTYKAKGKDIILDDPDGALSPEAVLGFYTGTYAELVTAKLEGPEIKDDAVHYRFVTTIGTKG